MNAKIELQNLITEKISNSTDDTEILKLKDLWHAVEEAIFDVPSEDEVFEKIHTIDSYNDFIQYLRNYKKPESTIFEVPKISSAAPEIDNYNELIQYLRNYKKNETDGK